MSISNNEQTELAAIVGLNQSDKLSNFQKKNKKNRKNVLSMKNLFLCISWSEIVKCRRVCVRWYLFAYVCDIVRSFEINNSRFLVYG